MTCSNRKSRTAPAVVALSLLVVFVAVSRSAWAQPQADAQTQAQARPQAQAPRDGTLILTVVDQSGGVIPGADVTVLGLDEVTKKKTIAPVKTSDKGVVTVEGLPPGRYSIAGEFPGFEVGLLRDVRIRIGDNRHLLVLPLKKLAEEVTVNRDKQAAAADRATTFGTALTREQIEALSDDPDEMARQLQDMAGPGATIRVDSFEGQQLPPKALIKSIHITRDMFAAENHMAGMVFVDIITQPGVGALRGSGRFMFYDSALDGQNPFIPKKGPAQTRSFGATLAGSLLKERSGFSLSVSGGSSYRTPNLYAATSAGTLAGNLNLRTPSDNWGVGGSLDYAITKDQTVRVSVSRNSSSSENLGVGGYDFADRAYSTADRGYYVRAQEAGPLGRRFFINTRFSLNWADSTAQSVTEVPTILVNGAFNSGGAQRKGGRHTRTFTFASDLDYVRGIQSWRTGVQIDGGRYRSDDSSNYLGTYTFVDLAAFNAGTPLTYVRRLGDPNIAYWNVQAGAYVQDDIRLRKNLTLSPGVRFELQTHLKDYVNVGPRFGITWAPFKSGKTTLRGSWGVFYDWLNAGTFEQTLRVDGIHQQELDVFDPTYPDPGPVGNVPVTNRYLLGGDLQMARNMRASAGISQQLTKVLSVNATYSNVRSNGLLVGQNLNAPVGGVRPDRAFANIIETVAAGQSRTNSISTSVGLNLAGQPAKGAPPPGGGPRFSWRRGLSVFSGYSLYWVRNNTDGAFSVPASGNLATEWGPSPGDIRHRVSVGVYSTALKNLSASLYLSASSGSPYTVRTPEDLNGDLIFNDRPPGVGRNTLRTAGQWDSSGSFTYTIGFGKSTGQGAGLGGQTISVSGMGGVVSVTTAAMAGQGAPRYRLTISLNLSNLANHANYVGYQGLLNSPFFGKPTGVAGVRRVNLSMGFIF